MGRKKSNLELANKNALLIHKVVGTEEDSLISAMLIGCGYVPLQSDIAKMVIENKKTIIKLHDKFGFDKNMTVIGDMWDCVYNCERLKEYIEERITTCDEDDDSDDTKSTEKWTVYFVQISDNDFFFTSNSTDNKDSFYLTLENMIKSLPIELVHK